MSKEHAKNFLKAIDENPKLYAEMAKERDRMQAKTIALAKKHGFDVSAAEVKAALEEKLGTELPGPVDGNGGADPSTCIVPFSEAPGR